MSIYLNKQNFNKEQHNNSQPLYETLPSEKPQTLKNTQMY